MIKIQFVIIHEIAAFNIDNRAHCNMGDLISTLPLTLLWRIFYWSKFLKCICCSDIWDTCVRKFSLDKTVKHTLWLYGYQNLECYVDVPFAFRHKCSLVYKLKLLFVCLTEIGWAVRSGGVSRGRVRLQRAYLIYLKAEFCLSIASGSLFLSLSQAKKVQHQEA